MTTLGIANAHPKRSLEDRIFRISKIGFWMSAVAVCIAAIALAVFVFGAITVHPLFVADLLDDLEIAGKVDALSQGQALVGTFFWIWVDLLGFTMLWQIMRLFQDLGRGAVLLPTTARRLWWIGVILVAMPFVSIVGNLIGGMILSAWVTQSSVHGGIAIEDADVYALIVGLLLVVIGHIMALAAEIDAENRAFV